MPARLRLTLAVALGCFAVAFGLALLLRSGGADGSAAHHARYEGGLLPAGLRAPDFALRDQDGRVASMRAYRGRVVVVTFLYSTCKDTCPLTAQQIRGAMDILGHDVPVLAISVDPAGDTPFHVKRFLVEQQMLGRMRYLTGTRAQLAPVWKGFAVQPQGKRFEHTAATFLVDRRGMQRVAFLSVDLTPEGLAHDLRALGATGAARAAR
jgi:protein SCO1